MKLDLSLSTFDATWPELRETALVLDENERFDTLWIFDHLSGAVTGPDRSGVFECLTTLAALAATTERIGLGSLVANVTNRHVGILATATATIQSISDGRLSVGLGAGSSANSKFAVEQTMLGRTPAPLADRHRLLVETIEALHVLWGDPPAASGTVSTSEPSFIHLDEPRQFLAADPVPPIVVGVNSARLAELVASSVDEINTPASAAGLGDIAAAAHRGGAALSVYDWFDRAIIEDGHPDQARFSDLGVDRLVLVASRPFDPDALRR